MSNFREPFGLDIGLADEIHTARVAVEAVLNDGDIYVDRIADLELLVAGNAVAHHVVNRCTDRFRKATVVQRGGDSVLNARDVFVADAVQFTSRDTGIDIIPDHIQHIGRKSSCDSHLFLLLRRFNRYGHCVPAMLPKSVYFLQFRVVGRGRLWYKARAPVATDCTQGQYFTRVPTHLAGCLKKGVARWGMRRPNPEITKWQT